MLADLKRGVDVCARFSRCVGDDDDDAAALGDVAVAPAVMFVNCLNGKKMEACIKKDLRERLMDFIQVGRRFKRNGYLLQNAQCLRLATTERLTPRNKNYRTVYQNFLFFKIF